MQISPLAGFFSTPAIRQTTKVLRQQNAPETAEALLKTRRSAKHAATKRPAPPKCGKYLDVNS